MQYLTFRIGEEIFAVDVIKAQEVLDYIVPTRVPGTPRFMMGVINLRGSVVPVVDFRLKFGMSAAEIGRDTCIIVMEIVLDGETIVVGALVDSVLEVMDIESGQIEPPPRIGTKVRTEFIKGMGNLDGSFLVILDIDKVFPADDLMLIEEASAGEEG